MNLERSDVIVLALATAFVAVAAWTYRPVDTEPERGRWIPVTSTDGASFSIDRKTIRHDGDHIEAWAAEERTFPVDGHLSSRALEYFQCNGRRMALKEMLTYDAPEARGNIVDRFVIDDHQVSYEGLVPGSVGEAVFQAACAGAP